MNIIPFDSGSNLPAFLKKVDVAALNSDLTAHAGGGFPVISIKGKVFAVVRDGDIVIRPIMNLALSYDHRLIDGQQAVSFLKQIKTYIEAPETLLLNL